MTENMSLKEWDRLGLLSREMAIYEKLMNFFSIQVFSHGNVADLSYENLYTDLKVLIIPYYQKNKTLKNKWHLFRATQKLKRSSIFKTNQIKGAQIAVDCSQKWEIPLVTRCGYLLSTFTEYQTNNTFLIEKTKQLEKQAFKQAKMSFVSSDRDREYVIENHGIESAKIKTLPNYVNQEVFSPNFENRENGHVLYIGRLSEQKNLFSLIDAFELSKHAKKLTLIGKGEHEVDLKQLAEKCSKPIEFISALPNYELPLYLQKASIYVLPSFYEGLPKTLLEAMSCGIACLGTEVEGIREVIEHGETGYLCKTDAKSIAKGMDVLLADDKMRMDLGKSANQKITEHYSLDKIAAFELSIYKEILSFS